MRQSVVRKRIARYVIVGNPAADKWLYPLPAQRRSAYGERNTDVPPGRALGDLYRLSSEVVKVVKKAFVFGHSVAKKAP